MKFIMIILCIILFACSERHKIYTARRFTIYTSEDNNWSCSGEYSADSLQFINRNEVVIWIDGKPMTVQSKLIKVFQNK